MATGLRVRKDLQHPTPEYIDGFTQESVVDGSPFADAQARDQWAAANLDKLRNNDEFQSYAAVGGVQQKWTGPDQPSVYDASKWITVSAEATGYTFMFDSVSDRDAFFTLHKEMLRNANGIQTLAFTGTTNLTFHTWTGTEHPSTYDASGWVVLDIVQPSVDANITYWGDKDTDLTMRARRDPNDGFLHFERRVGGSWESKMIISNSITLDDVLFEPVGSMPTPTSTQLGLYSELIRDSEDGNKQKLRPIFMDSNHNHFMVVAAMPNGQLRVPQNVDAALMDPNNTPLQYKYVILEGEGSKVKQALESLTGTDRLDASSIKNLPSGSANPETGDTIKSKLEALTADDRLDASAIKNLPSVVPSDITGQEIVQKLEALSGTDKLDASAIRDLYNVYYVETDHATTFPNTFSTAIIKYEHTGGVTQTVPDLTIVEEGDLIRIENRKTDGSVITLIPAKSDQRIHQQTTYTVAAGMAAVFIAKPGNNNWYLFTQDGVAGASETPSDIRDKLASLTGTDRLSATAIKDLPTADSQLIADVAANKAELARLKTDTSTAVLPVFAWRGRGVPTLPVAAQRAYYVHTIVLPDNAQSITMPDSAPEGAIFSVENNDRSKAFYLRPSAGQTINGIGTPYKADHDTLSYFIKVADNWVLAYGGVFPNNLTSLASTIQTILPNSLHTMDEIQAQLKDRLHTFREIQNEFTGQLHTVDDLRSKGFLQRECDYGFGDDDSVPSDSSWVVGTKSMDTPFTINVPAGKYLKLGMPSPVAELISKILVNDVEAAFDMTDYPTTGGDGTEKILITGNPIPAGSAVKIFFEYGGKAATTGFAGLEFDDGNSDASSVIKANLKGMKLTGIPGDGTYSEGEVEITAGVNIHMMAPNQQYGSGLANEITVLPPLNVFDDPDVVGAEGVKLEIKPGTFEPMHKPSYLAYLKDSVDVVGKITQGYENTEGSHHKGALWFEDVIVPAGAYIETRMADKSWGIQEADELDPNVTGGTDYLIAARIHMRGNAPSSGFVRVYLYNKSLDPFQPTGYLLDKNGQPMAVERHYKSTEELGVLDIIGVVNAKGLQEFSMHVVDSFSGDVVELTDRTEGASGIMIQALGSDEKTGLGLLQFEADTNQNIEFSGHYLGADRMTLKFITSRPENVVSYTANTNWDSVDGYRLINTNGIKLGVVDSHIRIQDDGTNLCDFNFGKVFTAEETKMLRGKNVDVSATLVDKDNGFNIGLMKWTGKPDEYTHEIFTTRDGGGSPVFQTGWSLASSLFVSEDAVAGDHTLTKTFVVPSDANNYALIIYPIEKQSPITLKLKELNLSVNPAFVGYALQAPELLNELHLIESEEHKSFVQDTQGYGGLRYTINDDAAGLPMPVGIPDKGAAPITLDTSANQITGSTAKGGEGVIKFDDDGHAKIVTTVRLWNEQSSNNTVTFWWAEVGPDGKLTKLPDSEFTLSVPANAKEVVHRFVLSHDFETNDRIALRAKANKADGAFLKCVSDSRPLMENDITFNLLSSDQGDDTELISAPYERKLITDMRIVPFSGISSPNFTFNIDIPADVELGQHSAVGIVGNNIVSVDSSQFSYNPDTKQMTVHVGTMTEGKIYLTFWG